MNIKEDFDGECGADESVDAHLKERRAMLEQAYRVLPPSNSSAFCDAIRDPVVPLEVLVRCLRVAIRQNDHQNQQAISEMIIHRVYEQNLRWARHVLCSQSSCDEQRHVLIYDLCADLHEALLRALYDPTRSFWEEHFGHCLLFERKRVFQTFLKREGLWSYAPAWRGMRIPRSLVTSLDQDVQVGLYDVRDQEIVDENAETLFARVEESEVVRAMLLLPRSLKAVVFLLFWEDRRMKDIACLLNISERTVRNRLHTAFSLLRGYLSKEKEDVDA